MNLPLISTKSNSWRMIHLLQLDKMPSGRKVPILPVFRVKWLHSCSLRSARNNSPGLWPLRNVISASQGKSSCTSVKWELGNKFSTRASYSECWSTHIFLFQTIMCKIVWIKIFQTRYVKSAPLLQHLAHPAEMPDQLSINPFRTGFPLHQTTLHEGLDALTKVFHVHRTRWKMLVPASPHCISSCPNITAWFLWKFKNSC